MDKKVTLIIGASSSLGCEIIREISEENEVIIAHYNLGIERLNTIISTVNAQIIPVQADLSSPAGVELIIEKTNLICESPDNIIFLAAPKYELIRFRDLSWDDFKIQIDVQLFTAVRILNHFLPKMVINKRGKIIFMLSSNTIGVPPSAMAHYVTAKYSLLGLMKSLATEYAGKKICINAVSPSMIETDFLSHIPEMIVKSTAAQHPLKRNGLPSDVAPLVKFLLSDKAGFINGVNIPITGGI
jgi:3-oxoacyl-[acyl-carrier protein] reductase